MKNRISPFLFGGVNVFYFNPKTDYNNEWIYLQPIGTEGQGSELHPEKLKYNLIDLSLVLGGGFKIKLNNSLIISFEFGWRKTQTDYLDDVSSVYINYSELKRTNGDLAAELSDRRKEILDISEFEKRKDNEQRGGDKLKDYYTMTFINFVYNLNSDNSSKNNKGIYCPKF